jgi:hypothetical protein
MSNHLVHIPPSDLATVVGGGDAPGTGATSLPQAIGRYFTNNGNGSFADKASVFGEKLWNRVKYSAAITPTIADYRSQIESVPGGADYLADIKRLRPSR